MKWRCLATNEAYAPYCGVVIYSLLKYRNPAREYDILILTKDMQDESKKKIKKMVRKEEKVVLRFVDMTEVEEKLISEVGAYYSIETNYRLFLLSDYFANYNRILYLDCDLLIRGDVSRLYDTDMKDNALAAVKDYTMDAGQILMTPMFVGNEPYSIKNYCKQVLGLSSSDRYFNAGVVLFDLERCRKKGITFEKASLQLQQKNYYYNDQDVLNILFENSVHFMGTEWNYIHGYQEYEMEVEEGFHNLYQKINHRNPKIIHYIGARKPWIIERVPFGEIYKKEQAEMLEKY